MEKTKRYLFFCWFLSLSALLAVALAFAIHAIVFYALEPKGLVYPQDLEALRIFAAHQVQIIDVKNNPHWFDGFLVCYNGPPLSR